MVIGYNLYTAIDHRLERMEQVTTSRWCTTVLSMETCRYGGVGVLVWKYAGGMEVWGIGMEIWRCGVLVWKYVGMEVWGYWYRNM